MKWEYVGELDDFEPDEVKRVNVGKVPVALYNLQSGVYATHDICTHAYACLSDGFLEDENIECPLHQGIFHVPTGKALSGPVNEDIRVYPVNIEEGKVYVGIENNESDSTVGGN